MSGNDDDFPRIVMGDCDCHLDYGDFVEHRLNTDVFGIVVGRMGSTLMVQVSPSLDVRAFEECTLRHADNEEYDEPEPDEPASIDGAGGAGNVIQFPGGRLTADTPTKGVA